MADRNSLTAERLRELLHYEPDTGEWTWLIRPSQAVRAGNIAGSLTGSHRYLQIKIHGVSYKGHRLAWLYVTGQWPTEIDHINRNRADCRFKNLREATRKQNTENRSLGLNSTSGFLGVSKRNKTGKWHAYITHGGQRIGLGLYRLKRDAIAARRLAEATLFTNAPENLHKSRRNL